MMTRREDQRVGAEPCLPHQICSRGHEEPVQFRKESALLSPPPNSYTPGGAL